jgi:hypothetical protein
MKRTVFLFTLVFAIVAGLLVSSCEKAAEPTATNQPEAVEHASDRSKPIAPTPFDPLLPYRFSFSCARSYPNSFVYAFLYRQGTGVRVIGIQCGEPPVDAGPGTSIAAFDSVYYLILVTDANWTTVLSCSSGTTLTGVYACKQGGASATLTVTPLGSKESYLFTNNTEQTQSQLILEFNAPISPPPLATCWPGTGGTVGPCRIGTYYTDGNFLSLSPGREECNAAPGQSVYVSVLTMSSSELTLKNWKWGTETKMRKGCSANGGCVTGGTNPCSSGGEV